MKKENGERICVYPGSFDPVTLGHIDIIRRCAVLFDRVIVAVLVNKGKQGWLPTEERLRLLEKCCEGIGNVTVDSFDGLLRDYAVRTGADCIVRGVRNGNDLDTEAVMADLNRRLLPGLETVFLPARPELSSVSSSAVREILSFHGDVSAFVAPAVLEELVRFSSGSSRGDAVKND